MNVFSNINTAIGKIINNVDDVNSLKYYQPTRLNDGDTVIVAGLNSLTAKGGMFAWDETSTATPDNIEVIQPNFAIGKGRWLRIIGAEGPAGPSGPQGAGLASVMAPTGSTLIGYRGRTVAAKLNDTVSVKDYGAVGDGVVDDTAAIQSAIDFLNTLGGGTLMFPSGTYKVSAPIRMRDRITFEGVGGHAGSLVAGVHSGAIFQAVGDNPNSIIEYVTFRGMALTGSGCIAILMGTNMDYLSRLFVTDCHFYGDLAFGIDGNLIFAVIEKSTFGYYGTAGAISRHIRSTGRATNVSNNNTLMFNRFYQARGIASVEWENGSDLEAHRNNWEQNSTLPLLLKGMPSTELTRNFFEGNQNTEMDIQVAAGSALVDSSPLILYGNTFVPPSNIKRLIHFDVTMSAWTFEYNTGTSMAGKLVTNSMVGLKASLLNMFPDLTFPSKQVVSTQETGSWNIVDASGSSLAYSSAGSWERQGNHVDVEIQFSFPANANNGNNSFGGLPYACTTVAVGHVLSNVTGGIQVATNAGSNTATFFSPGSLATLTNGQLSGKTIYLTLRYQVA